MKEEINYDRRPVLQVNTAERCCQGWSDIAQLLRSMIPADRKFTVAIECYPGVSSDEIFSALHELLAPEAMVLSETAFALPEKLKGKFNTCLTDDPVFAYMYPWSIDDYFDVESLQQQRSRTGQTSGLAVVVGAGASRIAPQADLLIHVGAARWELQQRQRKHAIGNLGLQNRESSPAELYKIAFFIDWRVADRLRHEIYNRIDFFLDLNHPDKPKMISGKTLRDAVTDAVNRPFRVVPFFDPGPWGGQWMRQRFGLPEGPANYAWGFDCVPEENSIIFALGECTFELPAIVLVQEQPERLLGSMVYQRFGAEFPIRFDLLDTMGGGNLSLQVHPLTTYIQEHFGMLYTQDESYYILDCQEGAELYLGLRECVDKREMETALRVAREGKSPFPATKFVSTWPTKKHDHFSIPAGTIHCSGAGNVVLEISATPYIFTFKLWDWGRMGLDGQPRPIHVERGLANIQWDRTTAWVKQALIDRTELVQEGNGYKEERTGLHSLEFLETRRHWFTRPVSHDTQGNLNVLTLVEGVSALVSSPTEAFAPLELHYAETLIVPASVGPYTIAPKQASSSPLATIKAYVRG